jgi:hypothetical protein
MGGKENVLRSGVSVGRGRWNMEEEKKPFDPARFDELSKCPTCGAKMREQPQVAERVGLYYQCPQHGRFRYSWDKDRLESVEDLE